MDWQVSKSAFAAPALAFLREVEETGRTLVVTNRGRPVLEVRPVAEKRVDPRELLRRSVLYYERPFDPVGEEDWEALGESR